MKIIRLTVMVLLAIGLIASCGTALRPVPHREPSPAPSLYDKNCSDTARAWYPYKCPCVKRETRWREVEYEQFDDNGEKVGTRKEKYSTDDCVLWEVRGDSYPISK